MSGVCCRGLDRSIEQIKESVKPRDQAIYGKWIKDRELDTYAGEHSLRLIRITDLEFKTDPAASLLKLDHV